jgi:hypothetical protein
MPPQLEAAPTFPRAAAALTSDSEMMTRFDLNRALEIALDRLVDQLLEVAVVVAGVGVGLALFTVFVASIGWRRSARR